VPNISRKYMPQVDTQNLGKALDMASDKVKVTKGKIEAGKLKKSQKELHQDKIEGIAKRFTSPDKFKPLIISQDNHIVDGHHRWGAAIHKWGEDVKIPIFRIHLPILKAIKLYKDIANSINEAMSIAARRKLARKGKSRLKRASKKRLLKMKRKRSNDDLKKASIRKAKTILMQKMMKKAPADMTMVDKMKFSQKIEKSPGKIQKIAKKILPKLKQAETERVRKMRSNNVQKANEDITIPINVGDTVLGGKFKNKRIVVKSIDKNEKGDITINGKPLLKFRLVNEANAVSGGKVHKFITGKNLTYKGKKYSEIDFELVRIDNTSELVHLKVLAPKQIFGSELKVPFKTIRRGPFLKTDTSGLSGENVAQNHDEKSAPYGSGYKKKNEIYFDRFGNKCKNPTTLDGRCIDKYHPSTTIREPLSEIPMADLQKIDQFADKKLNPVDVVLTGKHFFDRLNDPRNDKEISSAELIGFFKRLSKKKKEFLDFLDKYNQIVTTDDRTNINIPFMKQANKVIAKTVMRKKDFKTPNKKLEI